MLEQFYNYIVKELMVGYFTKVAIKPGDRYYVILDAMTENGTAARDFFIKSLEQVSKEIIVSGIYSNGSTGIQEEEYKTRVIEIPKVTPIIIGYDQNATEDYLVTMRNYIGESGGKYEKYASLFVLSERPHEGSNPLSSLCTACTDLKSPGKPFSVDYVISDIKSKEKQFLTRDHERLYFDVYLESVESRIIDGSSSLYDLMPALSALYSKTIAKLFKQLGFFPDAVISDVKNKLLDKDVTSRAKRNCTTFQRVAEIMSREDDIDKEELLSKFLDEKLSKYICSLIDDVWTQIDFQKIEDSFERRNNSDDLELVDMELQEEGLLTSLVQRRISSRHNRKTMTYSIVCDQSDNNVQHILVEFNKYVKRKFLNADACLEATGNKVTIKVNRGFNAVHTIGKNDNHHDFLIVSLPCSKEFFCNYENCFSITKKGEVIISISAEQGFVSFGNGKNDVLITSGDTHTYSPDNCYKLEIDSSAENDYNLDFKIDFQGILLCFVIKVKVDASGTSDPVLNPELRDQYCKWEDILYMQGETTLVVDTNPLTQKENINSIHHRLAPEVEGALAQLYDYYREKKAGPTLLPLDHFTRKLFEQYLTAVINSLESIKNGEELLPTQYSLTKLGVIECGDKIYLSSFNPLMVAYKLEYDKQKDITEEDYRASQLLTPFYLMPFISYNNRKMRPYNDLGLKRYKNWLCFELATDKPQDRVMDITTTMVCSKTQEFIKHFNYLFPNRENPIIISTIGIEDDRNVIKGILQFITKEYKKGVQRIELHEYVQNLMKETFFEKLNRLVSTDLIARELEELNVKIEKKDEYTSQEIIRLLFSRVVLYKHILAKTIDYCHIAFYQIDTGCQFIRYPMGKLRGELAFNGLVSIPSTLNNQGKYYIGFGNGGVDVPAGILYRVTRLMNSLYANEEMRGASAYQSDVGLVKMHEFNKSGLLNSIYENANWVTFLNPEMDIDFFYKQDLYIVHYTDQYSLNAKYDSITVTRHINQYDNMLKNSYESYGLSADKFQMFNDVMKKYFNCLNGNWLLSIINKTESQINEKMSLVATCIVMQRFMQRMNNVLWVPVSLDEILRVTGSIGLSRSFLFTKEDLGASGAMSDDLLMIGLDCADHDDIGLYLYPIEVKLSKSQSFADKAGEQVSNTYRQIKEHLFCTDNFVAKIYRTFFASQFLVNAEKLHSNNLMTDDQYSIIENCRYKLLNLKYKMKEISPDSEMGNAAIVLFFSEAAHSMQTSTVNGVNVCEIHFSEHECYEFVSEPKNRNADFLSRDPIVNCISNEPFDEDDNTEEISETVEIEDGETLVESPVENSTATDIQLKPSAQPVSYDAVQISEPHVALFPVDYGMKIILGKTLSTNHEIVFEPNNTKVVSHPNMGIIGTMGTGKTQFARSVIAQLAQASDSNIGRKPVGILIFDYKGDYKDEEFLVKTKGQAYKHNFPFNPLKLIQTQDLDGVNLPAVTADRISDSLAKAYGLGLKQQGNIKQIIINTYADFGITRDPATWGNTVPTMEDIIAKYFATYDANDKAYVLFDKLRDYTIFTADNNTCVSIFEWLNKVQVIDLTLYPDDTKKVIVSLILDLFYAEMKQLGDSLQKDGYRQLRSFIMVDEAHQFLKKDFNSLRSIISEGRMFGVGMILSTQNLSDFHSANEDYSQFILSWVIHHVNSISKNEIASIFGTTDKNIERYIDRITHAKLFESVCKIGNNVNAMRDLPFFELIKLKEK